ncbi:MAG: hypothetical protein E6J91_45925 [Deltaproteobacteria bacterium]|nr:MAG: hypothetical protein E6J91_45925 [Deltaproteobacteria bacterium]
MEACELLSIELRLDRIEAELAHALPSHLRAFARAHAHGRPPPPAPDVLLRATTLATARAALAHPVLADRGLALLRLAAPIAIESDPGVCAARSAPRTWLALSALTAARDAAAGARFGRRAIDVMHRLHGSLRDLRTALPPVRDAQGSPQRDLPGGACFGARDAASAGAQRDLPSGACFGARDAASAGAQRELPGRAFAGARDAPLVDAQRDTSGGVFAGARDASLAGAQRDLPDRAFAGARDAGDDAALTGEPIAVPDRAVQPESAPHGEQAVKGARSAGLPPLVAGWFEPDGVLVDDAAIARAWEAIRARHGVAGTLRFERAAGATPRTFVIEPRREVIIAIPARIAAPAERFAVLHELGHAVAALGLAGGIPRAVDEAIAAYVARAIECDADAWYSPLAAAARARRRTLAGILDQIERTLPELPGPDARLSGHPPSALWHDPGAQAAYVAAEALADDVERALGLAPSPGALVAEAGALCEAIDRIASAAI